MRAGFVVEREEFEFLDQSERWFHGVWFDLKVRPA